MAYRKSRKRAGDIAPWVLRTGALLLGCAIVAAIFLWPDDAPPLMTNVSSELPVLEVTGVQPVIRDDNGRPIWQLNARRIVLSADHVTITADDVERGIYHRDGKPFLNWQAKKLTLNKLTRDVFADGEVKVTGPDGFSLRASKAMWSNGEQEVRCDVPVQATLRGATFESPSVVYDVKNQILRCPKQVRVVAKEITVDAGSAAYDTRSGLLRCERVTRAVTHGFTISAADISYDTRSGVLRCGREVRVESAAATLTCGSAVVDTRARRLTMTGGLEVRVQPGADFSQTLPNFGTSR